MAYINQKTANHTCRKEEGAGGRRERVEGKEGPGEGRDKCCQIRMRGRWVRPEHD